MPFEVLRSRYDDDDDECELVAEEGGLTAPSTEQLAAAVPTTSSASAASAVKQAAPMAADPTVAPAPGQGAAAEADAEEEKWWDEDEDVEDSDDDEVMAALEWADMREGTRRHACTHTRVQHSAVLSAGIKCQPSPFQNQSCMFTGGSDCRLPEEPLLHTLPCR